MCFLKFLLTTNLLILIRECFCQHNSNWQNRTAGLNIIMKEELQKLHSSGFQAHDVDKQLK